jgi:hypothetical protein
MSTRKGEAGGAPALDTINSCKRARPRRRRRIALGGATALLAALSLACASTAATVAIERDEFTGQTEMKAEALMPPYGFTVLLHTTREHARTVGGFMMFSRSSEDWQYLRCHHVDMLADGQRVRLGESQHRGSVHRGGVLEIISVDLDPAALERVTTAREIRVRVCNDAWTISSELVSAMQRIGRELGFGRHRPPAEGARSDEPPTASSAR